MKAQAQALGLPMPEANTLSMALGTCAASPLQVAGAYAALAARGTATEPFMISLVKDESGSTLYKHRRIARCAASRCAAAQPPPHPRRFHRASAVTRPPWELPGVRFLLRVSQSLERRLHVSSILGVSLKAVFCPLSSAHCMKVGGGGGGMLVLLAARPCSALQLCTGCSSGDVGRR